jgi:hypothetical protein
MKDYVLGGMARSDSATWPISSDRQLYTTGNLGGAVDGWCCRHRVVHRGLSWRAAYDHTLRRTAVTLLASTADCDGLALQDRCVSLRQPSVRRDLLSDLLLAAQLFNNLHFRLIGDVVRCSTRADVDRVQRGVLFALCFVSAFLIFAEDSEDTMRLRQIWSNRQTKARPSAFMSKCWRSASRNYTGIRG